jgi:hypothetical protein
MILALDISNEDAEWIFILTLTSLSSFDFMLFTLSMTF